MKLSDHGVQQAVWKHFSQQKILNAQKQFVAFHPTNIECEHCDDTAPVTMVCKPSPPLGPFNADRYAAYRAELAAFAMAEVIPHLTQVHGFAVCPVCGDVIKKSGLSAHKKSFGCQEQYRVATMAERGLTLCEDDAQAALVNMRVYAERLRASVPWDDPESFDVIEAAIKQVYLKWYELAGMRRVRSRYVSGEGWLVQRYAPPGVAFFLKMVRKKYGDDVTKREEYNREVWEFLEADEFQRDCVLGGLDLSMET